MFTSFGRGTVNRKYSSLTKPAYPGCGQAKAIPVSLQIPIYKSLALSNSRFAGIVLNWHYCITIMIANRYLSGVQLNFSLVQDGDDQR